MIVTLLRGGLGNQLFQLAAGEYLARLTGGSLRVDDRFMHEDKSKRDSLHASFRVNAERVSLTWHLLLRTLRWMAVRMARVRWLHCNMLWVYSIESSSATAETLSGLRSARLLVLDGYWQSCEYPSEVIDAVRAHLEPRITFGREYSALLEGLRSRCVAAIHVRRGDYVHDPETAKQYRVYDDGYYLRAVEVLDTLAKTDAFYVFSDEITWVRDNLLFDDRATMINLDQSLSDSEEFLLMMRCHHFVISNSTFSWWAARLCEFPEKVVIAPKRWIADSRSNEKQLIPSGWRQID